MNNVTRFRNALTFQPVDCLPCLEWANYWDQTVNRWHGEGLSAALTEPEAIRREFGLASHRQLWITPFRPGFPEAPAGGALVSSQADYEAFLPYLYPLPYLDPPNPISAEWMRQAAQDQQAGQTMIWFSLYGFFWFPRVLLGIEPHLCAFYDHPALIHRINRDLLRYHLELLEELTRLCTPMLIVFAEDMAYNHGPMVSKHCFDEFLAPYYRPLLKFLKNKAIVPILDCDGCIHPLIDWYEEVGVEGIAPLEHRAGVDIVRLRKDHPTFKMIGGFDKTVMHEGEPALRREFERIFPVMCQGGYIPSVDHQTPPDVSLDHYRVYVRLLKEYCRQAALRK